MRLLHDPLMLSFASVAFGTLVLLLSVEYPKARRLTLLLFGAVAVLFVVLACWRLVEGERDAFILFLLASVSMGNLGRALQRANARNGGHS